MQSKRTLLNVIYRLRLPNMVAWHANLEIKVLLIHEIQ